MRATKGFESRKYLEGKKNHSCLRLGNSQRVFPSIPHETVRNDFHKPGYWILTNQRDTVWEHVVRWMLCGTFFGIIFYQIGSEDRIFHFLFVYPDMPVF